MNKEIIIDGKKIFYRSSGNGNPVVLVHGFGEDGKIWNNQAHFLNHRFQLIIPDLPGSGQSDITENMSIEGMAAVIKEILVAEKIQTSIMIGHSMGGYITLAFAQKYPGMLKAFGLFHSSAYADSEEKKTIRQKGIGFIKEHGAFEFLKTTTPNLFSTITKDERPELIDEQIGSLSNFSSLALVKYYQAMIQRPDRTAVLKETESPVLFIMGKYDTAAPMKDSLEQCHLPGKSYIHILHNSAHMGMLEEKEKSNQALNDFLSGV